jgi:hypothetical protein
LHKRNLQKPERNARFSLSPSRSLSLSLSLALQRPSASTLLEGRKFQVTFGLYENTSSPSHVLLEIQYKANFIMN